MKKIFLLLGIVTFFFMPLSATDYKSDLKVKAYPNPYNPQSHKKLTIQFLSDTTGTSYQYIIYNLNLKDVYSQNFSSLDGSNNLYWHAIDKQGNRVAPGLYYMKIIVTGAGSENNQIVSTMIKILVQ